MPNITKKQKIWSNSYLELYHFPKQYCGLFIAINDYIPIESFKTAFNKAAEIAQKNNWKYFIFDKSNLTVFHQPSMEWYYTEWKKQLLKIGLSKHYKILPKEDWFKISVEAGKEEIKTKYPNFDFNSFEVIYVENIMDAIESIELK